jgi:ATP-dependent Clp protease ATP-binding subunit ClpC
MFQRFTDRARRVVVQAQEEARALGHSFIGTEHLLLALTHEGGVAPKALEALGIGPEAVRQRVEEAVGRTELSITAHIPFTPRTRDALQNALLESHQLGHTYIGTEHILLGVLREGEGVGARVLTELGADLNEVRQQVTRILDEYRREHGSQSG